jgi:apolipoprotein N-acyltransferase
VLSGALLFAAFPPVGQADAAWIALAPLIMATRRVSVRRAALLGWLAGVVYWVPAISWLRFVTIPGWITLAGYSALYFIPYAVWSAFWLQRRAPASWLNNLVLMATGTAIWVGSEYFRTTWFTGFPWNPFGGALYRNIPLIQLAHWGGVAAVSALVVWANMAVALTILRYFEGGMRTGFRAHPEILLGLLAVVVALTSGARRLRNRVSEDGVLFRAAAVQPLIPIPYYYSPPHHGFIREQLETLTDVALRMGTADLIIWPETAVPDELRSSEASFDMIRRLVSRGAPLLTGSIDTEWTEQGPQYFNSSFLVDTNGVVVMGYDKRHLVMFGEYVPLRRVFPFLKKVTPITESFVPGTTSTVFRLERPPVAFSALICFEDTLPHLARESVRNGARLLINQTDNGWFDRKAAPWQHMTHCVFRCVENGVPAIRVANTGVTCSIDEFGRIRDILDDGAGNTFVSGCRILETRVPMENWSPTFYHRHGEWFAKLCGGVTVAAALTLAMAHFRLRKGAASFAGSDEEQR